MSHARPGLTTCSQYDAALHALSAARQRWAETSVNRRLALLRQIKDALAGIAPAWVAAVAAAKGLPAGDPLAGEEWLAGPCALMVGCNGLIATLEQLEEKTFLRRIPLRTLADGRLALRVVPGTLWDRLLLSGVRAEIWMQPCGAGIRHPACRAAGQAGAGAWRRQCGLDCATGCATQAVY